VSILGDYTIVADVGRTLLNLLQEHMTPEPIARQDLIGQASPADKGDLNLSLFLYKIRVSGESMQANISNHSGGLQFPALPLELSYLLTAHSSAEIQFRAVEEQIILGKAIQVFHENGIIRGSTLQGTLADYNEEIRIVAELLPIETMIQLFPQMPYRLSFAYTVGPVYVNSKPFQSSTRIGLPGKI
jgi:hypothetical protein